MKNTTYHIKFDAKPEHDRNIAGFIAIINDIIEGTRQPGKGYSVDSPFDVKSYVHFGTEIPDSFLADIGFSDTEQMVYFQLDAWMDPVHAIPTHFGGVPSSVSPGCITEMPWENSVSGYKLPLKIAAGATVSTFSFDIAFTIQDNRDEHNPKTYYCIIDPQMRINNPHMLEKKETTANKEFVRKNEN